MKNPTKTKTFMEKLVEIINASLMEKDDELARQIASDLISFGFHKLAMEKLVEKFNQWADERIVDIDLNHIHISHDINLRSKAGIDALNWAKQNLERLAKEVLAE